jgi:hypothetical protein
MRAPWRRRSRGRAAGGQTRTPGGRRAGSRADFVRIDYGPTQLQEGVTPNIHPASLPVALINASKGRLWCPPFSFTPVQDDPHVPPVPELVT